jgi:predicted acylesterase/phospholipase RssA
MTYEIPSARPTSYDKKVGLVLQGGGALGSYQAGVYEALASSEYLPDWVAGISIGAINAAIIAGNAPEDPIETRPGFTALLGRIAGNGVRTIIVETANRFARDLMVQEVGRPAFT